MENALMTQATASMNTLLEKETSEILSFVTGNVEEINQLSAKILAAQNAADIAKSKVADAKKAAENAKKQADERSNIHWYDGKAKAINDVQTDVRSLAENQVSMAESQIALAEVQQRATEAQELTFDFQKKLVGTTAMMIKFSTASIATSRLVVRELEARMNGASREELSDIARQELESVVYQIKAQQDIMSRQDQLTDIVREIDERVTKQLETEMLRDQVIEEQIKKGTQRDVRILEHDRSLKSCQRVLVAHRQKEDEHDKLIMQCVANGENQNARLGKIDEINVQQYALINQGAAKDEEQDARLSSIDEHNTQQDAMIAKCVTKNEEQDTRLGNIEQINTQQNNQLAQSASKNDEQDARLASIDQINNRQDNLIDQCVTKSEEQDARLDGIDKYNAKQDALIAQCVAKDEEQDVRLCGIDEHNAQQDILIAQAAAKDVEQDARLNENDATNAQRDDLLQKQAAIIEELKLQIESLKNEKGSKVFMYVTATVSAIALILSVIRFFI